MNTQTFDGIRAWLRIERKEHIDIVLDIDCVSAIDGNVDNEYIANYSFEWLCNYIKKVYLKSSEDFDIDNFAYQLNEVFNDCWGECVDLPTKERLNEISFIATILDRTLDMN